MHHLISIQSENVKTPTEAAPAWRFVVPVIFELTPLNVTEPTPSCCCNMLKLEIEAVAVNKVFPDDWCVNDGINIDIAFAFTVNVEAPRMLMKGAVVGQPIVRVPPGSV